MMVSLIITYRFMFIPLKRKLVLSARLCALCNNNNTRRDLTLIHAASSTSFFLCKKNEGGIFSCLCYSISLQFSPGVCY